MSDYDLPPFEPAPDPGQARRLPGGISLQAAAAILLVLALLAALYLFFGPTPQAPSDLATATPNGSAVATRELEGAPAGDVAPPPSAGDATPRTTAASTEASSAASQALASPGTSTPSVEAAGAGAAATSAPAAAAFAAESFVVVGETDGFGLRLRFGPGFDYATIRIVPEGERLKVLGDAEQGEGYTWHRLQDELGNVGWGARDFLSASERPAIWSPPLASPTFEADAGTP